VTAGGDGSIFIADSYNQVVRRIAPDGTISRIAGEYSWGFSGDGGDPTRAQLRLPVALAVSSDGVLYVVDQNNDRIRMVLFDDIFRAGLETDKR
jgi:outer membrane protein assembly factor BamB